MTALAAFLRLRYLGQVPGNPFYDAAVHTMSQSWHAFLFGALDPSGGVSVDKPPVDLWFQVLSVKLFGFTPTALKLPQALAGIASVPLLFDLVRRPFGRAAGLAAAAALAVLPVAVLTARSDTMDTFMAFVLLCAAWVIVLAIERERPLLLVPAGALLGLAFNVKLFQALLPLPAFGLCWLVASRQPFARRLGSAALGLLAAVVVGFAWIVPVALTPASQRPYPIGSTNGSIWNLVFVFNGADRLHGRPVTTPDTLPAGSKPSRAIVAAQQRKSRRLATNAGLTRLLGPRFAARIGSELVVALGASLAALLLGAVWLLRTRRRRGREAAEPPERVQIGAIVLLGGWAGLGYVLFSGISAFHPRYFEAISPAVAAVGGGGLCLMALRGGTLGRLLAAAAVAATGVYASTHGLRDNRIELAACLGAALLLVLSALTPRRRAELAMVATAAAVVAVLIAPAAESLDVVRTRAFDAERSGAMPPTWPPRINHYLSSHRHGARYLYASIAPAKAAPLIADDPQPVLMLTSYRSRPLVSVARVRRLVQTGQVRYFLLGRRCTSALTRHTAACPATAHWAIAHSTDVTPQTGIGHTQLLYRIDLCGRATGPAAARARARGRSATRSARQRSARSVSHASPATCVRLRKA
ncbi:MAG: hypothetical protein QOC55_180 [Thermoleophilaceae bacterium]|nr:hypothetical protein [Thermoleophilaceae bacterium]